MRPLVAVRRAAAFDPGFLARSPLLWPLSRAAKALERFDDFPPIEALARVFEGEPSIRFVPAAPRRRRRTPVDTRALYDARIAIDREVPTRGRCWHDFMNALVWGTFPFAKRALHSRQHRAIAERLAPDARKLPPARTRELDALALLDEGGVVVLSGDHPGSIDGGTIVFGHAIYESLVLGVAPAIVAGIGVTLKPCPAGADLVRSVDHALAAIIGDDTRLRTPRDLKRLPIAAPHQAIETCSRLPLCPNGPPGSDAGR